MALPQQKPLFNTSALKAQFPIFQTHPELIFLDSAASSQKPQCVIDSLTETYTTRYANVHRGLYGLSAQTTKAYEDARTKLASFLNAPSPEHIIFTRNATEAINLVAHSWGRTNLSKGDNIVLTTIEHHANLVPWQILRDEIGCTITFVPVQESGEILLSDFEAAIATPNTKLAAFPHVSNALGTLLPVQKMVAAAKDKEILTLVDGCQAVPRLPVNVQEIAADFYVLSGHKMYAPSGIGALIASPKLMNQLPPYQSGGDMIKNVTLEKTTFTSSPARFEAGTPAIEAAIALGAACDFLKSIGMETIAAHEFALTQYAHQKLAEVKGLTIIGNAPQKIGVVSFIMDGIPASDIATLLDEQNICVRTGHHCAEPTMHRFNIPGTARASFGIYNDFADIDALAKALHTINRIFKK